MGRHNRDPGVQRSEFLTKLAKKVGNAALGLTIGITGTSTVAYAANVAINNEIGIGSNVPDKLPSAVAKAISKAVYLHTELPPSVILKGASQPGDMNKDLSLSGVYMGNGNFLSAGHALKNPANQPLSDERCSDYVIRGTMPSGESYSAQANQAAGIDQHKNPDMSVFRFSADTMQELSGMGVSLNAETGIQIASQPPKHGDTLYFINWEPTVTGEVRDPTNPDDRLSHPAVFAGTVLNVADGVAMVTTGERSYNNQGIPDDTGRGGMSGGMVLNQEGALVGLSNYGSNNPAIDFVHTITNLHIGPFGLPGNGQDLNWVNLVTAPQVNHWERQAAASPACPYIPTGGTMFAISPSGQYNALGA